MEPTRATRATLVDVLDRVLDRGLVLDADIMIHMAGIPLLGIKLRAAIAAMETMLDYGMWHDWDAAQRAVGGRESQPPRGPSMAPEEEMLAAVAASHWSNQGVSHTWRPGRLYVTSLRVLLSRDDPIEVLFECPYEELRGVGVSGRASAAGEDLHHLALWLASGEVVHLRAAKPWVLKHTIEEAAKAMGFMVDEDFDLVRAEMPGAMVPLGREYPTAHGSHHLQYLMSDPRAWQATPVARDSSIDVWAG